MFRLSTLFQQLADVLLWLSYIFTSPVRFFHERAIELQASPRRALARCLVFSVVCISLAVSCASLFEFDKPDVFGIGSVFGVILVWFMIAMSLHPFLRLLKAKGTPSDTAFVFLMCASALHVFWVPLFSISGKASANTKVRIEYRYLVTYGYGDWRDVYLSPWLSSQGKHHEIFIKEHHPERVGTVLAPVERRGIGSPENSKNQRPIFSQQRIPLSQVAPGDVTVSETAAIKPDGLILKVFPYLVLAYYLSHYLLLAIGLSVVHQLRFSILFGLALLGPMALWGSIATVGWIIALALSEL